jgi:hypothetical protein
MVQRSDEVYANSIFASSDFPNPPSFTSVLSLNVEKYTDPSLVHCLYGMSKVRYLLKVRKMSDIVDTLGFQDFCSNGVRIGVFISQNNKELHAAVRAVS